MIALLYIPFAIWFGRLNAIWASKVDWSKGIKILHGWNGLIHLTAAALVTWLDNWKSGVALLFITKIFFDLSYIYFHLPQRLPIDYQPKEPKAITDKIEIFFIKNGLVAKIIYALIVVILLIA